LMPRMRGAGREGNVCFRRCPRLLGNFGMLPMI
jgi:hypothetical protein